MRKNNIFLVCFAFGIVLIGSIFVYEGLNKENKLDCNNLGVVYLKPSEKQYMQTIKDDYLIVSIPEEDLITAKTEVLNCPNADLYLGYLK